MKIHLGCWHRYFPDWVHVDLCDLPHIDYRTSVDKLPMFEDQSADIIYASHVLEYFDRDAAKSALTEWARVLKPKGVLRLSVPDFEKLIKVYRQKNDLNSILGPLYGKMKVPQTDGSTEIYHKMVFDEATLTQMLIGCGYFNPQRYDWRNTEHAQFDDHSQAYYPHMDKKNGIAISLNIEAQKSW